MKYADMPLAMWLVFVKLFRNNLTTILTHRGLQIKQSFFTVARTDAYIFLTIFLYTQYSTDKVKLQERH